MIAIVDYKAGNLTSVKRALDYLGVAGCITADPDEVRRAERIIFPGVGHAATAMLVLRQRGLDGALREAFQRGTPILGTCVGAQISLSRSQEGDTECLGLIAGDCLRFPAGGAGLKVPHMGWNAVTPSQDHPVLHGLQAGTEFYFVHSYYLQPADGGQVYGTCEYDITFPAIIGQENFIGTQFHSEKSGRAGLAILQKFANWTGAIC